MWKAMNRGSRISLALCIALTSAAHAQSLPPDPQIVRTLRHNDELLLEAIHRGDRETWRRLTTSDFMYVEEGHVLRRAEFLSELAEDGYKALIIVDYEAQQIGDTVQVFHRDDVPQRAGKQSTKDSHLLMTETWQRVDGEWRLRLVHTDRIRRNPPAIALNPQDIDPWVGTYRNGDATYRIERHGLKISGQRSGKQPEILEAEARDVLFQPDNLYVRKVVQRDAGGKVTGFVDRDENSDRLWTRVDR
ncbi:nuclear transport factor 2 family protein [Luteibacter mycovicinus]|uniref:nuclear transport factor 2 family protein n=1 Tax=Luteibacter mycovicinus TaxID=1500890 RepID=UPI0018CDA207|nr:nuclear transport factor 2 family protein [Luteibacter sp. 9143a]